LTLELGDGVIELDGELAGPPGQILDAGGLAVDERPQDPAVQATLRRWASLQAVPRRALREKGPSKNAGVLPDVKSERSQDPAIG
jgi:hypothetical protein